MKKLLFLTLALVMLLAAAFTAAAPASADGPVLTEGAMLALGHNYTLALKTNGVLYGWATAATLTRTVTGIMKSAPRSIYQALATWSPFPQAGCTTRL